MAAAWNIKGERGEKSKQQDGSKGKLGSTFNRKKEMLSAANVVRSV